MKIMAFHQDSLDSLGISGSRIPLGCGTCFWIFSLSFSNSNDSNVNLLGKMDDSTLHHIFLYECVRRLGIHLIVFRSFGFSFKTMLHISYSYTGLCLIVSIYSIYNFYVMYWVCAFSGYPIGNKFHIIFRSKSCDGTHPSPVLKERWF